MRVFAPRAGKRSAGMLRAGARWGWLFLLATLPLLAGIHPELREVKTVYLLPMSNGFDQYLANQLTRQDVFLVVTDPAKADAVFTGEIGERFEQRMKALYPPAPAEAKPSTVRKETKTEKKPEVKTGETESGGAESAAAGGEKNEAVVEQKPVIHISTFGRGRGNVFLVKRSSGHVIWSTYYRPGNFGSKELNRSAGEVVRKLKAALAGH